MADCPWIIEDEITPIAGKLYRLVESQQQVATRNYVDTLDEQAVLEDLLEASKPPAPPGTDKYHYLLRTPFRYPPLPHGSRFGGRHEAGIFYAGTRTSVTLAESAYYRFVFFRSINAPPLKEGIRSEHTLFSVGYHTDKGVQLDRAPFDVDALSHPSDYHQSQATGSAMRAAGVEAFEYRSARDTNRGTCVGLFSPSPFRRRQPGESARWFCDVTPALVSFKAERAGDVHRFPLEQFLHEGKFPMPA